MTTVVVDHAGRTATVGPDRATFGPAPASSASLVGEVLILVASNQVRVAVPAVERVVSYVDQATALRRIDAHAVVLPAVAQGTLLDRLRALGVRGAALPVLDHRSADEILGYDDDGLPR